MSAGKDGGQAFPIPESDMYPPVPGMSLRDYFAAKAMQAFVARGEPTGSTMAESSYEVADALLAVRQEVTE